MIRPLGAYALGLVSARCENDAEDDSTGILTIREVVLMG